MQHFSAQRIAELLTYRALADAVAAALVDDRVAAPSRWHLPSSQRAPDATLIMPAWRRGGLSVFKVVTVRSANAVRGLPTVQGISLIFDEPSGAPIATIDATALTPWRTAATALLAARYLARPGSAVLLMVGSGAMADHLIRAYAAEFPLREILIWSRTEAHARRLAIEVGAVIANSQVRAVTNLDDAVGQADIISCATLAKEGLVAGTRVRAGTHVALVGAFTPDMRESDDELIKRAEIYVDTRAGALKEAGDLVQPLRTGVISIDHIRGELADLIREAPRLNRGNDAAITLFKSVGHGIEDLAAAEMLLATAATRTVSRET